VGGIESARAIEPLCLNLIKRFPSSPDALHWMSVAMLYQCRYEEALDWAQRTVEAAPWHPFYLNTKAIILNIFATPEEATECFYDVLRLKPNYPEGHMNLANILRDQGNHEEAFNWYQRALELKDNLHECWNNLGVLYKQMQKRDIAVQCFEKAAAMCANYTDPHTHLAALYGEERNHQKSIEYYQAALHINPTIHEAWLHLLKSLMYLCEWNQLQQSIDRVRRLVNQGYPGGLDPFTFLSLPGGTAEEQRRCAELYVKSRFQSFMRQAKKINFSYPAVRHDKIRIGYLSADYRQHAVALSLVQVLELHNKDKFEVFAYAYTADDNSDVRKRVAACSHFVDLQHHSFLDAARRIHNDGIDIAIDLTAYTAHGRSEIMALRPAPVQVNYLGYPGTMAAPFIDYLIGDPIITPIESAHCFSETLALLPHCYFPNDRTRQINTTITRADEKLPDTAFIFCSFNQAFKINPTLWNVWCDLLHETPDSILWLHALDDLAQKNLRRLFIERGLEPSRLHFAKAKRNLADHLGRLRLADLALDTIPYNGHTTTSDALWVGLPVLTCLGDTFTSRVAASMLTAARVPELIANSLEDYRYQAIELVRQPAKINALRQKILDNRDTCPLYDSAGMARNLEKIFTQMHDNRLAGKPPQAIRIANN